MKQIYLRVIALLTVSFAASCIGGWDVEGTAALMGASGGGIGGGKTGTHSGAGGDGVACVGPADCAAPVGECLVAKCIDGVCGAGLAPAGTPLADPSPGDCKRPACDGAGLIISVGDPTDIFDDGNECTIDTCAAGGPVNVAVLAGDNCPSAFDKFCNGAGACVECQEGAQCPSGACGLQGQCQPRSCVDGQKSAGEADVDCGGICGASCAPGRACASAADCAEGVCAQGKCAFPSCSDGVENGTETGVDCGGGACFACGPLGGCKANSDCAGHECSGTTCIPNCFDGIKNNSETDLDCGGPSCGDCSDTTSCAEAADCATGYCVDGVCCDRACGGDDGSDCQACNVAGSVGTCSPITSGAVCRPISGACDVAEVCNGISPACPLDRVVAAGEVCASGGCSGSELESDDVCNGSGSCIDGGSQSCPNGCFFGACSLGVCTPGTLETCCLPCGLPQIPAAIAGVSGNELATGDGPGYNECSCGSTIRICPHDGSGWPTCGNIIIVPHGSGR